MNATATKITAHANCSHAATKTERAKCRKNRATAAATERVTIVEIVADYYGGMGDTDAEQIMARLRAVDPALTEGYYNGTQDVEEIVAAAAHHGA